jgi:tetrahydromethanopterin S-methyltransferase subunit G
MKKTAEDLVSEIDIHLEVISELEKVNTPLNPTTPSIEHLIGLIQINLRLLKKKYPKEYRSIPKSLIQFVRTHSGVYHKDEYGYITTVNENKKTSLSFYTETDRNNAMADKFRQLKPTKENIKNVTERLEGIREKIKLESEISDLTSSISKKHGIDVGNMSTQEIKEYTENLNLNKQASDKKQKKRNRKYLDTQDWITIIFLILAFLFVFQDFIF